MCENSEQQNELQIFSMNCMTLLYMKGIKFDLKKSLSGTNFYASLPKTSKALEVLSDFKNDCLVPIRTFSDARKLMRSIIALGEKRKTQEEENESKM